ncbi:MAG: serine/threonine protein kinase [Planctomycetaceae bacterium]|jgi:serine/threonine protein kinase|nr:serine/threonine protein kinase [Planctomycetaceae bacterium]
MNSTFTFNLVQELPIDEQIDFLADQFEQSWTDQSILRLESRITAIPETIRHTILTELLAMDIELRFKNGLPANLDPYKKTFPQYCAEIESAYQNVMASRQLGEYEFYERIGQGGMGMVYRARHRLLDRIAAVKLLRNNVLENSGSTERFLREIRLNGQLLHPNIIKTEYAGKEKDRYYLAMEFIEGENIRQIIERHGSLALPIACEIICQAASGLQYASERNIIHRDIKPGNIMISRNGIVKILDFGLGKFITFNHPELDYSLTTMGSTMGSVDYIAPEQWEDAASVKIQADIYSLGCLFFFLLTGHAPYESPQLNRDQRMIAHIKGDIPSLAPLCENIPPKIENCYKKMLAPNPQNRFAEPAEIIEIFEPFTVKGTLQSILNLNVFSPIEEESTTLSARSLPNRRLLGTMLIKYLPRTVLMILIGYGIYFAGTMKSSRHNETTKIPNSETLNLTQIDNHSPSYSISSPIILPIFPTETLAETLQFIGYSGHWWFEEIPWYLPFIRETAALSAENKNFFLKNKNISKQFISSFIPKQESAKRLLDFLVTVGVPQVQNQTEFESLVNNYLSETTAETNIPASVLHTQAVLLHQLAIQNNNPEYGQQARERYAQAIEGYNKNTAERPKTSEKSEKSKTSEKSEKSKTSEKSEISRLLGNLCRFDAAHLNWWFDNNADNFYQQVNKIKTTNEDDTVFRAELPAASAERFMEEGQNRDDFFNNAFELIEKISCNNISHPMLEKLHYRFATALMRQWRLTAAEPHWNKVQELAAQTAINTGTDPQIARLCEETTEARLNLAISARYFGDLNSARFRYRDLIGNIQDVLTYLDTPAEEEKLRLTQKLAEAMEQLADCTLFTPTHFGNHPIPNSQFFVTEAESWYTQAREITSDPQMKFVLQCKLALLRLNLGNLSIEEHQKIRYEIQNNYTQLSADNPADNPANNPVYHRAAEYYQTIDVLFGSEKTDVDTKINRIKNGLDNNRLNSNMVSRYAGERLDLQLFCIHYLLKIEQQNNNEFIQQDIERYLDPILLQHLVSETRMRPFLLPYYDLAVNCRKDHDLFQTVLTIRTARCQRYSGVLPKSLLVFYFPIGSENGFAVFLLPEQQESKRFDLGFNRQQVIEAAEKHQTLLLPDELVSAVKHQWAQSIPVDISWDDSVCWSSTQIKKRLSNTQWVFDKQLPAALILGIVR